MNDKDHRYKYVRSVWKAGDLTSFNDIFRIVPRSVVSSDLGLNYERFNAKINNPRKLMFGDIQDLSKLTGIPFKKLMELVVSMMADRDSTVQ